MPRELINVNRYSKFCRMLCHGVASCPEGGSRDETVVSSRDDPPAPAGAPYQRALGAPEPVRDAHVRTRGAPAGRPAGRRAETRRAAPACDAAGAIRRWTDTTPRGALPARGRGPGHDRAPTRFPGG